MKKIWWFMVFVICTGCVTVKIPKYLKDEFPYKKKFYATFDNTLTATKQALKETGWKITEMANPSTFEQDQSVNSKVKQILIFTEIRQTPLILSSRYMSLNLYLRSLEDATDVEIRYISVMPMLFKNSENYKNDDVVNKIFDRISQLLEK